METKKEEIRFGLDLSNLQQGGFNGDWEAFLGWWRGCKNETQAISVIRSLPYLGATYQVASGRFCYHDIWHALGFAFALEVAAPPITNETIQHIALNTIGEKMIGDDGGIKDVLYSLERSSAEEQIRVFDLFKKVMSFYFLARNRSGVWPGKSNARFLRLLICWHPFALGFGLFLKDFGLFWSSKGTVWSQDIKDGLRRLLIEAGELDAFLQVSDEGGVEIIAEYLSEELIGAGKFSCTVKELVSSHVTRVAAFQSLHPIERENQKKKYLAQAIKTLELLLFEREARSLSEKKASVG